MNDEMFIPYNAGSFGNFTSYTGEDELAPSSVSPAAFSREEEENVDGGGVSPGYAEENEIDDYVPTTTHSVHKTNPKSLMPNYRQPTATYPSQASSSSVPAPPVYSPVVPPPASTTDREIIPVSRRHAPTFQASHHQPNQQHASSVALGRASGKSPHVLESYDDDDEDSVASLTPQQKRQLQQLLNAQQQRRDQQRLRKPSYWERAWGRRRDILKLLMLACVIIFALATNAAILHYVTLYTESADGLSPYWEAALRFGYPLFIFFVIWVLKVHVTAGTTTGGNANSS